MRINRALDTTFLEYHRDASWVELLPTHQHTSRIDMPWSGWNPNQTILIAFSTICSAVDLERVRRSVSLEVTRDFENMKDDLSSILSDFRGKKNEVGLCIPRLNKLWIEFERQRELSVLIDQLLDLQRVNLITRYEPENQEDMHWCLQNGIPLSRHAEHIFRQVRLETAKFELWKHKVQDKNVDQVSTRQPPCPWNSVLKNMSLLARDLYGDESNPDPLPFDNIMIILEDSYARRREFFELGSFTSIEDLRLMDADVAAPTLVHDLWAIKKFHEGSNTNESDLADLERIICTQACSLFSKITVSSSGHMCRGWLKESANQIIHQRKRAGWLEGGIPKTIVWDRKLVELHDPSLQSSNSFQWEVDCFQVRNECFTDWEKVFIPLSDPPAYEPPAYEPPAYEPQGTFITRRLPSYERAQASQ